MWNSDSQVIDPQIYPKLFKKNKSPTLASHLPPVISLVSGWIKQQVSCPIAGERSVLVLLQSSWINVIYVIYCLCYKFGLKHTLLTLSLEAGRLICPCKRRLQHGISLCSLLVWIELFCWASVFSEWSFVPLLSVHSMPTFLFLFGGHLVVGFSVFQLIILTDSLIVFHLICCDYSPSENCRRFWDMRKDTSPLPICLI